jgi:hypothetical protein
LPSSTPEGGLDGGTHRRITFSVSTTPTDALPFEVGAFGNFEARMLRAFRAAVDDWDEVCSALGAWEAQHLTGDASASAMAQHRNWVTALVSWGRRVQRAAQEPGFPDPSLAARVDARLRHLQDKLALWHGKMSPADEERIVHAAFPRTADIAATQQPVKY